MTTALLAGSIVHVAFTVGAGYLLAESQDGCYLDTARWWRIFWGVFCLVAAVHS